MVDRPLHWREDEHFVYRQVELDAWRIARATQWAAVAHATLRRKLAARIGEDFELARLGRELQTAGVVNPITDFRKDVGEESFVKVIGILQGTGGIADQMEVVVKLIQKDTGSHVIYSREPRELLGKLIAVYDEKLLPYYKTILANSNPDGKLEG